MVSITADNESDKKKIFTRAERYPEFGKYYAHDTRQLRLRVEVEKRNGQWTWTAKTTRVESSRLLKC